QTSSYGLLDLMATLLLRSSQADIDYTGRTSRLAIESVAVVHVNVLSPVRMMEHGRSNCVPAWPRSLPAHATSVGNGFCTGRFSRILEDSSTGADHVSRPFAWSLVGRLRAGQLDPRQWRSRSARATVGH